MRVSHFVGGGGGGGGTCCLSSLCLVAHKASTECLQFSLLAAAALASSHVRHPALFLSFSTVLRQVVLGLPLLLFPSGVHDRAMLVWLFLFRRRICPIIFHLLFLTSSLSNLVSAFSSGNLILPVYFENPPEAFVVKHIYSLVISHVHLPCLTSIQ